mgnify:CR=1 FL=1
MVKNPASIAVPADHWNDYRMKKRLSTIDFEDEVSAAFDVIIILISSRLAVPYI